ncbi:MAG: hypothetical protein ACTH5D_12915 [Halomonas sp.]|uniref:hypothetical protein n=1 Tax=Halomonas sp. TaxID=1486246 RepID=UPI003F931651
MPGADRCTVPETVPAVGAYIKAPSAASDDGYIYGDRLWERMQEFVEFQGLARRPDSDA